MATHTVQDGTGEFTTLAAALADAGTAAGDTIEISGSWDNDDTACATVEDADITIQAVGSSKFSGVISASPTTYRLRTNTSITPSIAVTATGCLIDGLEIRQDQTDAGSNGIAVTTNLALFTIRNSVIYQATKSGSSSAIIHRNQSTSACVCNITNCIIFGWGGSATYNRSYTNTSAVMVHNVNSCTIFDCGLLATEGGLRARNDVNAAAAQTNVFNSVILGNYADLTEDGTYASLAVWDCHNSIDSDNTIATYDPAPSGCLASRTATDSDTPGAGNWVVFENVTSAPYDLRLKSNAENDAQNMHAVTEGAGLTIPYFDIIATSRPQSTNYDCGAFEFDEDDPPIAYAIDFTEDFTAIDLAATYGSWATCTTAFAPANRVAVVLLMHNYDGSGITMGVRAVGSSLERKLDVHEQEAGGYCSLVKHVQCNADGKAQFYRESSSVIAYCLGYYPAGITFTEEWTLHEPTAADWRTTAVGQNSTVFEFVCINNHQANEVMVGTRAVGSSLARYYDIDEAESADASGINSYTSYVQSDTSGDVQLYRSTTDGTLYRSGYFSSNVALSEAFTDVTPVADGVWAEKTAPVYYEGAVALVACMGTSAGTEEYTGARGGASSVVRYWLEHEAEGGGYTGDTLPALVDSSRKFDTYFGDVSDALFYCLGYLYDAGEPPTQQAVAGSLPAMSGALSRKLNLKRSIGGSI